MTTAMRTQKSLVLIEGHNLTLASGTGIATYARQLSLALNSLGYDTAALLSTERSLRAGDAVLSQIMNTAARPKRTLFDDVAAEWLSFGPWAAKAHKIARSEAQETKDSRSFSNYAELHVVPYMVQREFAFFRRYRRRMSIRVDSRPQLFHATRPTPLRIPGCPNIYTLHDIVPLRLPYTTMDDKKLYLGIIRELCRTADHIVTVSEFSRQDIIKLTGIGESRITNTYQSVSLPQEILDRSQTYVERDLQLSFGLDAGSYFLFLGALEPKKNVSRLIDAYVASGSVLPLIIAGGEGWMNKAEIEKINSDRFLSYRSDGVRIYPERKVRRISYVPLGKLVSLIRGARALLFPSIYEGFGLPIAEAMLLGTPVLTSNVSSLPEIAGDAAILVDPYDTEAMARAIRTLDADGDLRAELSRRGRERAKIFSPANHEQRLGSLYRKLI